MTTTQPRDPGPQLAPSMLASAVQGPLGTQESQNETNSNTLRSSSQVSSNPPHDVRTLPPLPDVRGSLAAGPRWPPPAWAQMLPSHNVVLGGGRGAGERLRCHSNPLGAPQTRVGFLTKEAARETSSCVFLMVLRLNPLPPFTFQQTFAVSLARQVELRFYGQSHSGSSASLIPHPQAALSGPCFQPLPHQPAHSPCSWRPL